MHLIKQNAPPESIEEDDEDDDDDDDDSQQLGNDVSNVNAHKSMSMSVSTTCYSDSLPYKKIASDTMTTTSSVHTAPFIPNDSLRRRNVKNVMHKTATKPKSVQFMPLPNISDDDDDDNNDEDSPIGLMANISNQYSKPLKKIVFNGTFPIDDPYSSRF